MTEEFQIWPTAAPGSEAWDWSTGVMNWQEPGGPPQNRMLRNVVTPTLTLYKPAEGTATGAAIIIAPGGAFHFLMIDKEGGDLARRLASLGLTAFVLNYRVARTPDSDADMPTFVENLFQILPHPGPKEEDAPVGTAETEAARLLAEEDGRQAIRFVRRHAARWGVHPQRIGIAGFSAGGGIAVNAALEHDAESRPDFVGGVYPGYRPVGAIPENPPPLFLAIADDDEAVAPISVTRLYADWHKARGSVELHVFANGAHGFGFERRGENTLANQWTRLFEAWLRAHGHLTRS